MRVLKLAMFAVLALIAACSPADDGWTAYTPTAFAEAQSAGKPIIVHVHAPWCPTCKAQLPTLDELRKDAALKNAVFLRVDFDTQKDFLQAHRVTSQSTVLVFSGAKEAARSVADTDRERLRALVLSQAQG
ncbi:MAG: thioredoxin family protein [Alphaproteobacteria bacterium]